MTNVNAPSEVIFLLGIGYILLPEDLITDTINDEVIAANYTRHFDIVPNPEGVPNYKHDDVAKRWVRVW